MPSRPTGLYTAAQVRALDRAAIDDEAIPGITLMRRAGAAALTVLRTRWPAARRLLVLCGGGNNGGDGYVLARLAREAGLQVRLLSVVDPERLRGDAAQSHHDWLAAGGRVERYVGAALPSAEVVVDAVLGTGLDRPVEGEVRELLQAVNAHPAPVLAIDLPSGLGADSGRVLGAAVRAAITVSFIGRKRGLYTAAGPDHAGVTVYRDLQVPARVYDRLPAGVVLLDHRSLRPPPPRALDSHKGRFGHLAVVGGAPGMAGACRLAGEAALRVGSGLVTIACHERSMPAITAGRAELMTAAVEDAAALRAALRRATVLAVGPGLASSRWSAAMLGTALDARLPGVIDADGLNLLAQQPESRDDWVLTPHPAEAGRLLAIDTAAVQEDRFAAARALQERYGGVIVLKGRGTLIADGSGPVLLCDRGHPAMSTAGAGDVLTGLIAGLLAQGLGPGAAAGAAVWAHAVAGERLARVGTGLLAGELAPEACRVLAGLEAPVCC